MYAGLAYTMFSLLCKVHKVQRLFTMLLSTVLLFIGHERDFAVQCTLSQ